MDSKKLIGVAVMAVALMGAGCSGSSAVTTAPKAPEAPTPVAEVPKVPVKFSETKGDLFGLSGKYGALSIAEGTGTCLTKMPYTELSFSPSAPGNNFMLRDKGVTIDDRSSSTPGSVMFDGKTVDGKAVDCILRIPYAGDAATLSCADAAEKEVCNATYSSLMASPL